MTDNDFTEYRRLILDKLDGLGRGQESIENRLGAIEAKQSIFEHDYKAAKRLIVWIAGLVGAAAMKLADYLPKLLLGLKG